MISIALTVREVEDHDVSQIIEVWNAAGVSRPWNDPLKDIEFARQSPQGAILVGLIEQRLVATTMVGEDGHRGWVYYLATHPEFQRRGIARQMMEAAEVWLKERGIWKMQLLIRAGNMAAKGFYERIGFKDIEAVCYQKIIAGDPGASDARHTR